MFRFESVSFLIACIYLNKGNLKEILNPYFSNNHYGLQISTRKLDRNN